MKPGEKNQQRIAVVAKGSAAVLCILCLFLSGCSGTQSSLDPAGTQADQISHLWWRYLWITVTVYFLVLVFLILPIRSRRLRVADAGTEEPILNPSPRHERRLVAIVSGFVALSTGI